jgi:putative transposase
VGWEASGSKQTRFVESAIRQAAALRSRQGHPIDGAIHHSDAGSAQYTSVRFSETLALSGIRPSVGSIGDAYDNALAETTIGLYKNECIRADSPFRRGPLNNLADVELITADYVAWYNQQRLMHRFGRVPPAEAEAQYYSQHVTDRPAGSQNPRVHETRDGSSSTLVLPRLQFGHDRVWFAGFGWVSPGRRIDGSGSKSSGRPVQRL